MPEAIVDGSSIVSTGTPRVADLMAVREAVERAGYDATIYIDPALKDAITGIDELVDRGFVKVAPRGAALDSFVLDQCEMRGGILVSKDDYADLRTRYPWIEDLRVAVLLHHSGSRAIE